MNIDTIKWYEKYRPSKLSECFFQESIMKNAEGIVNKKAMPDLLFHGSAGCGKTTLAKALCNELGYHYMMLNGSTDGRLMETLRNDIVQYASGSSLEGDRKVVLIDEAEGMTQMVQEGLRACIEEFQTTTSFILTCNNPNKIIAPLVSRCTSIDFTQISKEEKHDLLKKAFKHFYKILVAEGVKDIDQKVLLELIRKYFPDYRQIFNLLQWYTQDGNKIDVGILKKINNKKQEEIVKFLKTRNFTAMRSFVAENSNIELEGYTSLLWDNVYSLIDMSSCPDLVLLIRDSLYKNSFVSDREISKVAFLCDVMTTIKFLEDTK